MPKWSQNGSQKRPFNGPSWKLFFDMVSDLAPRASGDPLLMQKLFPTGPWEVRNAKTTSFTSISGLASFLRRRKMVANDVFYKPFWCLSSEFVRRPCVSVPRRPKLNPNSFAQAQAQAQAQEETQAQAQAPKQPNTIQTKTMKKH